MKPHNASLRMSHKTGLHKSICIISVGITSNTHQPNKLTQGVFFCSGSSEQHRLLIMLIHSVSCCSALMGTSVNTVSLALMSICVCVCVFRALSPGERISEFASPACQSCRRTQGRGKLCLLYHSSSAKGQNTIIEACAVSKYIYPQSISISIVSTVIKWLCLPMSALIVTSLLIITSLQIMPLYSESF